MSPDKVRVNLYLERETYQRAQRVAGKLPGVSVSAMFNDLLGELLPGLEAMADAAAKGDERVVDQVFAALLAENFMRMMRGGGEGSDEQ